MIINIQYIGMPFNETLTDNVIRKLEEISDKYEMVTKANILIKYRNSAAGEGAFCEIELHLPNSRILAGTPANNLELAIMQTIQKLKKELLKKISTQSTSKTHARLSKSTL